MNSKVTLDQAGRVDFPKKIGRSSTFLQATPSIFPSRWEGKVSVQQARKQGGSVFRGPWKGRIAILEYWA